MPADGEGEAVLLYTSGTTAAPKAAVLRHRHLAAYVVETVEFAGAGPDEAVLVCVPPYHVAGLANLLSNLYAGRRVVYLEQFDAGTWVDAVRREGITNAMVVPTMLARICDALEAGGGDLPTLRALWSPVGQQIMIPTPGSPKRCYGIGAVNYWTGETVVLFRPHKRRIEIAQLLQALLENIPPKPFTWLGTMRTLTAVARLPK